MKKVILFLWFMPILAFSQVSDNFETGNISRWTQSPANRWIADNVSPVYGTFSLHHAYDNPDAGTDQLGIPLLNLRPDVGSARWSFVVRHGYDPSSSNNWAVFLMSDNGPSEMHPGGSINGFAIGVNLTGYDDTLRLWKIRQGNPVAVITVPVNWQNNIGISSAGIVDIERTRNGLWTIWVSSQSGQKLGSATGTDPEIFAIGWLGVYYKYSSTRDRLLWLDDIKVDGAFISDTLSPSVVQVRTAGRNSVEVTLDEDASSEFSELTNFNINNDGPHATFVNKLNGCSWLVYFQNPFTNKMTNTITIKKICDKYMNCREIVNVPFIPVWAEPGDIIISEIMADPLPPVALPPDEYLELKNNTVFSFDLKNWKLVSEGQSSGFPASLINPDNYLIICHTADTSAFSKYGRVTGLKSFPVLTDEGKWIAITDSLGNMIHGLEYSREWYGDILKSGGGWSLEMIDISYPFSSDNNWKASVSRTGGTPGKQNSVAGSNRDIRFKGLENVFPVNDSSIRITFSEPVRDADEVLRKVFIGGNEMRSADHLDMLTKTFLIKTQKPLIIGQIYSLSVPQVLSDFSGNRIEKRIARFGLPQTACKGDILFNELLFNHLPGLPDYIEFVNNSVGIIDASRLFLVSVNDAIADTSELEAVSEEPRCILPGALYAITTDRDALLRQYISSADSNVFEVSQLPSMPDDGGHLVLFNRELDVLDEVRYNEKMHFSLLSGTEGISLEKIRPGSSSTDSNNWHSASEKSGWGTPGAPNSIYTEKNVSGDEISFSSSRISPDNDGIEDLLLISFNLTGYDNVITISIFDEAGNLVRKLAQNLMAGSQSSIFWDGTADDNTLVGTGIYILLVNVFDDKGKTHRWKRVCTVIR